MNVVYDPPREQKSQESYEANNNDVHSDSHTPLSSPTHADSPTSCSNSKNSTGPRGKRSFSDVYEDCPIIHLDVEQCERCFFATNVPHDYSEASKHKEWQDAMENEMKMIEKNET